MPQFIVALRQNHPFGYIFSAYFAEENENAFLTISEPVTQSVVASGNNKFSEHQIKIVNLIENYSVAKIVKIFSTKTQTPKEFIQKVSEKDIVEKIRPYIEKNLIKIIEILQNSDIQLFYKKDNYTTLYPEEKILIHKKSSEAVFNIIKEENQTKYFLSVSQGENDIKLFNSSGIIISNNPCRLFLSGGIHCFEDIDAKKLLPFFTKEAIIIPATSEGKWYETFAKSAISNGKVKATGFKINYEKPNPKPILTLEKDWKERYVMLLYFLYNDFRFNFGEILTNTVEFEKQTFSFKKTERNFEFEQKTVSQILELGIEQTPENTFILSGIFSDSKEQQNKTVSRLGEWSHKFAELGIEFHQSFYKKKYFTEKISLNMQIGRKKDWFDIRAVVKFGNFEIPFINLRDNILNSIKEFLLPDGTFAVIPEEWFAKYSDFFLFAKPNGENLKLEKFHSGLLESEVESGTELKLLPDFKEISEFEESEFAVPPDIRAELRPYQTEGFRWMLFMQKNRLGVCLADDMGLGKTLQTITLITKTINDLKESEKRSISKNQTEKLEFFEENRIKKNPCLIVVPISLIHNWENEIMKFSPFLKVLKYRGNKREHKIEHFNKYDVIIAGYGVVRNDIELLKELNFLYVILDESQFIKNSSSQVFKAVKMLNSDYKLVLTGTPLENSLSDLWSQMDFLNEGILGNFNFFKNNFINSIEKNQDENRSAKLKKIINPFILRRTKNEVAKDLPDLTQQTVFCRMTEEQAKFYESEKSKIRNELLEQIVNGTGTSAIPVLQALTRLRQAANHPKLIEKNYDGNSGKFDEALLDIEILISENHKILIFSSFVKHLKLFAEYFEQNSYKYSILTGKTVDREKVIDEFQNDSENRIFLISIKAGGTGLNLTQADYVLILDPWWNPAVELQAVNRAHRIGQHKKVMVYRYITEKTVEEKIQQLQEKKLLLAENFISDENPMKNLTKENLMLLFE